MVNYASMRVSVRKKLSDNTWDSAANAIVVDSAYDIKVSKSLGKKKDIFSFRVVNVNNNLFETYYDGDGASVNFTLKWGPINSDFTTGSNQKVFVYVGDVLQRYGVGNDYTITGSTLTFNAAPASGVGNIKVAFPLLENDDLIRIHRIKNEASFDDADIVDEGTITVPQMQFTSKVRDFSVKGEGFISQLFNGLVFSKPSGSLTRAHLYIQDIIAQLNEYNQDRTIYGESAAEWTNIGNDTTTKSIQYTMSYKSAIDIIEDLSSNEHTGNGQYIYYVLYDSANDRYEFNWKAKPTASSGTLVEGTDAMVNIKPKVDNTEVVNAAIYNCGLDARGNAMEFPFFDWTSQSGSGAKWKYITRTNTIGEALLNNEFENNSGSFTTQTLSDGTKVRTSNFPNSYVGYTMQFEGRNNDGTLDGSGVTPSDDDDFNDAIWQEAKWQGWFIARDIIDSLNDPRVNIVITMDYGTDSNSYVLGDIWAITLPSFGLSAKKLRLIQIDYTTNETTLEFKEDEKTVTA